ncbi:MAG: hypothetical protein QOF51_3590 [Chloroflexota bacterium]|nr:hypothetical protein [Chloroflexota bacterium]
MAELQVHLLRFRAEVMAPLRLPPATGAALRGALFGTLRRQFCVAGGGPACGQPALAADCPVCFLLAPVDEDDRRGRDVPRPYVLRPPLRGPLAYEPGQTFEFELATFGRALGHFPYTLLGVEEMGRAGMGARREGGFRLDEVWAVNPLRGRQEAVYQRARGATVHTPGLPVSEADVHDEAATLATRGGAERLRIELEAPLRLVEGGRLVKPEGLAFRTLFARLLERLTALGARYAGSAPPPDVAGLLRQASEVQIAERRVEWQELFRGSGRHERALPMGGLVGGVTVEGDLAPLLPWLVWGSLTHVGKDAAMGNGRYRLEAPS